MSLRLCFLRLREENQSRKRAAQAFTFVVCCITFARLQAADSISSKAVQILQRDGELSQRGPLQLVRQSPIDIPRHVADIHHSIHGPAPSSPISSCGTNPADDLLHLSTSVNNSDHTRSTTPSKDSQDSHDSHSSDSKSSTAGKNFYKINWRVVGGGVRIGKERERACWLNRDVKALAHDLT